MLIGMKISWWILWLATPLLAIDWVKDPVAFHVTGEAIELTGEGGLGARTAEEYEDLRLSFDYKLAQWAEAAVVVRAPRYGRPLRAGVAITLAHDFHQQITSYVTGALTGRRPPLTAMPVAFEKWQHVELTLRGAKLRVEIDGVLVQDTTVESGLVRGHVMFANLGHRYAVRRVKVEDLGRPTRLVPLFTKLGEQRGGGKFRLVDGVVIGENGHGILYDGPRVKDLDLTLYVRPHNRVNAGVFLRGAANEKQPRGFEVQVYSPPDAVYPTGSIYGVARSVIAQDYEEKWFLLRIRLVGRKCQVWVDGDPVASTDRLADGTPVLGQVGLQIHSDAAWVEFAQMQMLVLDPPPAL